MIALEEPRFLCGFHLTNRRLFELAPLHLRSHELMAAGWRMGVTALWSVS